MPTDPLIFLSAGEASGDHYGAALIEKLRAALPEARFTGLGGVQMEAAGQTRVVRAEDVAVMGITEILRHVPRIVRSYRGLVREIRRQRPDVAVLIDFPDVNFRLARHLKRLDVPVLWFVSPQLWAWKRGRLRWVQSRVAKMLTIFPFEASFYRNRGVDAEFVGHPLAELPLPAVSRQQFAEMYNLNTERAWIALLPGSRGSEVQANLPAMAQAAGLLGPEFEYIFPVAPGLSTPVHADAAGARIVPVRDARAALLHARAAVVASGTATVQAAVLGTPFVAVYRVSKLTFLLAKQLVRYPAEIEAEKDIHGNLPIAMPNLVAGRRIVPELLQGNFTGATVADELRRILPDSPARVAQMRGLARVRARLLHPSAAHSIDRLREAVLEALGR